MVDIRSGNTVIRNGKLVSEKNPTLQKILEGKIDRNKGVVIINGEGYSVPPAKQQDFIQNEINRRHGTKRQVQNITIPGATKVDAVAKATIISKAINKFKPRTSISQGIINLESSKAKLRNELSYNQNKKSGFVGTAGNIVINSIPPLWAIKHRKELPARAKLFVASVGSQTLKNIQGIGYLPSAINELRKHPIKTLKEIPGAMLKSGKEFIVLSKKSPTEAIAVLGTELVLLKGSGKVFEGLGQGARLGIAKVRKGYQGELKVGKTIKINTPKEKFIRKGVEIYLKKRVKKPSIKSLSSLVDKVMKRKPGQFRKFQKTKGIKLKVIEKIPTESFAKQVALAGKSKTLVSSQANALVGIINKYKGKVIRKPIDTTKLSIMGRRLLKKFDKGKITGKQLMKLDKAIRKTGSKGILERSFFADPRGRIRPSRLGKKAKDLSTIGALKVLKKEGLKGFKGLFKREKPQVLVFPQQKIQRLPKSLKSIGKKLSKERPLTASETKKFLKWQNTKSGKFKPVGFMTRESEVTLAPGEYIKRVKRLGAGTSKGKVVQIVQAKVVKASGKLKKQLIDAKKGKLNAKELKKLNKTLKRKSGMDYGLSSYGKKAGRYYSGRRRILSYGLSASSKYKPKYKTSYKPKYKTSYKPNYNPTYKPKYKTTYKPKYTPKYKTTYKPKYTPKGTPKYKTPGKPKIPKKAKLPAKLTPTLSRRRARKYKSPSKKVQGYDVYGLHKKKFIKLNLRPLKQQDALSRGTYAVDHSTAKTFKIIPKGFSKKLGNVSQKERNYFNRARNKVRGYKIRKGKKFTLRKKYIEKRRYGIDTRGEKRGLSLARLRKRLIGSRKTKSIKRRKSKR